jgi:hypothetical protein
LELLDQIDPAFRAAAMADWLNDPEFRKDAVDYVMVEAERARREGRTEIAREQLLSAFRHARHSDQVLRAVSQLKSLGVTVDPIEHMGFLVRWHLLGPFDAPGMTGFSQSFLPEQKVDLAAEYLLGSGRVARWQPHTTSDSLGQINLIQAIGPVEESVGYAYCELDSPRDQLVELRGSADDNLTVWLNGERVLGREQWLNGTRLDRFVTAVKLNKGRNRVLVKICQGPHHVDPDVPNNWSFQVRFCDATGAGVGARTVEPPTMRASND